MTGPSAAIFTGQLSGLAQIAASDAALAGFDIVETRADSTAVQSLIASESLRELSLDRLAFRIRVAGQDVEQDTRALDVP